MLGLLGGLLGLVLFPLLTFEGLPPLTVAVVAALPVMFWIYLATGLIAWWRRPRNSVGMLLVWAGVGMWLIGAQTATVPAIQASASLFSSIIAASLIHLLLAFPSGRLSSTLERVIVVGMYVTTVAAQAMRYFVDPPGRSPGWSFSGAFSVMPLVAVTALSVAVIVVLAARWARARPEQRWPLGAVYGYAIFVVVFVPLSIWAFRTWWPEHESVCNALQAIAIAALPVVVLIAFLLGGFRRTADLEALGAWLGESEASRRPIRDALAEALGDPTVVVTYWSAELGNWVSAEGLIAAAQDGGTGRARYEIGLGGAPVAAVEYDGTLLRDPHEVERAANLAALALERERLSAELRASLQAVIDSRERLAGAADAERRRISRGLHDGLQARLVLLGIEAQRIAAAPGHDVAKRATALRDHIDQAADELRAIVHDLVPPALIEVGVVGAVEELVESMPIPTSLEATLSGRLGDTVEMTAYLVVAEALTNVVKHSGATHCTVSLRANGAELHIVVTDNGNGRAAPIMSTGRLGTGLAGIADRVAAIGGASGVETPRKGGTTIWAQIPYES